MKKSILNNIFIGFLIITLITLTACSQNPVPGNNNVNTANSSQELKSFKNINELKSFLETNSQNSASESFSGGMLTKSSVGRASTEMAAPMATDTQANTAVSSGAGTTDYSQTNVQVKGVDEADFIKNDNRYIYMIADNKLVIIDGIDATNSKIVSKTDLNIKSDTNYGQPTVRDIFLNKDKVVIFVDAYERSFYFEKYNIVPIETSKQNTEVYEYDVSDKESPKLITKYTLSGYYFSSRMINDIVYVVTQENLYNWQYYDGPMISYAKTVIRPTINYFDNPEQNYQMNTITSINLQDDSVVDSEAFMLGYGNTLMVSENNIYIAYQKQRAWCFGWRCMSGTTNTESRDRFMKVVVPLLEGDIKTKVNNIISEGLSEEEEWSQISAEFSQFYTNLKEDSTVQDKYQEMFVKIEDALNEYDAKKALEDSKTIIHKIAIKDGQITYETKGEVDGRLLNQFSMDEFEGNLRVATTVDIWLSKGGRREFNNVYVLDKNLNIAGSVENLAENESIYSTRFMGDKLYMVTFRQVDPFFVIDLSNPEKPAVLGYLKIPGYSSYLHPISDKLIIGVGKETGENEYGGVTTKGVKVSLFDVSDFNNPKEIDKYEIGLQGTDSPILYDHKAFLYSPTKNIMVIPVTEIVDRVQSGPYNYRTKIWNGAYVFKVSESGFVAIGKVKHSSSETEYYNWFNTASVMRSLYIDNALYTVSSKFVKVSDLDNALTELNTIALPYSENNPVPIMY
jgi:inhibitor of cysteine peptidase